MPRRTCSRRHCTAPSTGCVLWALWTANPIVAMTVLFTMAATSAEMFPFFCDAWHRRSPSTIRQSEVVALSIDRLLWTRRPRLGLIACCTPRTTTSFRVLAVLSKVRTASPPHVWSRSGPFSLSIIIPLLPHCADTEFLHPPSVYADLRRVSFYFRKTTDFPIIPIKTSPISSWPTRCTLQSIVRAIPSVEVPHLGGRGTIWLRLVLFLRHQQLFGAAILTGELAISVASLIQCILILSEIRAHPIQLITSYYEVEYIDILVWPLSRTSPPIFSPWPQIEPLTSHLVDNALVLIFSLLEGSTSESNAQRVRLTIISNAACVCTGDSNSTSRTEHSSRQYYSGVFRMPLVVQAFVRVLCYLLYHR